MSGEPLEDRPLILLGGALLTPGAQALIAVRAVGPGGRWRVAPLAELAELIRREVAR